MILKKIGRFHKDGLSLKTKIGKKPLFVKAMEEADVELDKDSLKIFGIIKVNSKSSNCEHGTHYLLRVIGKIININDQTKDLYRDAINYREFIEPENFGSIK